MALAVTHIIGTIFILDLFRHYVFGKKNFPRRLVIIGGLAGLAPDIDIPLSWLVSSLKGTTVSLHGLFTHSLVWVALFLAVGAVLYFFNQKMEAKVLYVIAAGWFIHILLDCAFNGYSTFLWPFPLDTRPFCPGTLATMYRSSIDAIILVAWLIHEEVHNYIKDYF